MRIVVTDESRLVCDAEIDVPTRKPASVLLDDESEEQTLKGLAVLCGCVEAVLKAEFEKKFPVLCSRCPVDEVATPTRPDVPGCEGGCE